MNRVAAYATLADILEQWRGRPRQDVVDFVGKPPVCVTKTIDGETLSIDLTAAWADAKQTRLRITAVADGSSHWALERLEESLIVECSDD